MKRFLTLVIAGPLLMSACGMLRISRTPEVEQPHVINLALTAQEQRGRFVQLDYGIRLNVTDGRASSAVLKTYDGGYSTTSKPQCISNPDVRSFVPESMRRYMRTLGFNLDADIATDYMLSVTIKEFHVSFLSGIGWSGTVQLGVEVYDHNRTQVFPSTTAVGRATMHGSPSDWDAATATINNAYAYALEDIDWDRIAFLLKRADTPAQEGNKKVIGEGNTALENTVIRWYVDSAPKGADVSTRIVSSTPEVKNTNSNYVGSTPYETTETFDIKGLTFNNSGDVQIEVTCEKSGYITQKKRFNLRQVIEQKEISTKFNLIRED